MTNFDLFVLARSIHVLAIIFWIGGVAFITTVLLPALNNMAEKEQRIEQLLDYIVLLRKRQFGARADRPN